MKLFLYCIALSLFFFSCQQENSNREPKLFLTKSQIASIPDSKLASFQKLADSLLLMDVQLPNRGGNWPHFYVDPINGKSLHPGKKLGFAQWEHFNESGEVVPSDSTKYNSDYDGVLILTDLHTGWTANLFALGVMYQRTGEIRYAEKGLEIIRAYNRLLPSLPFRHKDVPSFSEVNFDGRKIAAIGASKLSNQALGDFVWFCKYAKGMDLLWDQLNEDDKNDFKSSVVDYLKLSAKSQNIDTIHNIRCWEVAALGLAGYLTGNDTLIKESLYGPFGLKNQLMHGLTPDGHWYERAPSYHFYAMEPIQNLLIAAKNHGLQDEFMNRALLMYKAPLQIMMPNFELPTVNDCRPVYMPDYLSFYLMGSVLFPEDTFLVEQTQLLASQPLKASQSDHDKLWNSMAALFNADKFMEISGLDGTTKSFKLTASKSFPLTGFDVLQQKVNDRILWAMAKYDSQPGISWHQHPDMLSYVLYYRDRPFSVDPGHAEYGSSIQYTWFKTSLAHNALMVNEQSNRHLGGENLLFNANDNGLSYTLNKIENLYPGLDFYRMLALLPSAEVLVVDYMVSEDEVLMDVCHNQLGQWQSTGMAWSVPEKDGYRHLKDAQFYKSTDFFICESKPEGWENIKLQIASSQTFLPVLAYGIGLDFETNAFLLNRVKTKEWMRVQLLSLEKQSELRAEFNGHSSCAFEIDGEKLYKASLSITDGKPELRWEFLE